METEINSVQRFFLQIGNSLQYGVFTIFWSIFVSAWWVMLEGLYRFTKFISLDLINFLIFRKSLSDLKEGISLSDLPVFFITVAILAVGLFIFLFAAILIKHATNKNEKGTAKPLKVALKQALPSIFTIIAIPILFLTVNLLLSILLSTITRSFSVISDPNREYSPIQAMFATITDKGSWIVQRFNNPANGPWEWYKVPSLNQYIDIFYIQNYSPWTILLNATIMWIVLFIFYLGIIIDLFKQTIFQYFLFIISPSVAISSINDDGKKLKSWKNAYFKSAGLVVIYMLLILLFFGTFTAISNFLRNGNALGTSGVILLNPLTGLGVGWSIKFLKKKLDSYFGVQSFSAINYGKKMIGKGIAGAATIASGGTLGSAFATGGVAAAIGGVGKIASSKVATLTNSMKLTKSSGLSSKVGREILSTNGMQYDAGTQNLLMNKVEATGLNFSGIKSSSQFEAHLAVANQYNNRAIEQIEKSDEWKSGNISQDTLLRHQKLKNSNQAIEDINLLRANQSNNWAKTKAGQKIKGDK